MRAWIATGVVVAASGAAWAQDYTITTATGKLETRPAGATALGIANGGQYSGLAYTLPFEFPYYGRIETAAFLTPSGFITMDTTGGLLNQSFSANAPGRDATTQAFPYTSQLSLNHGNVDGVVSPFWDHILITGGVGSNPSDTWYWTVGTAPNRKFVVSWENFLISGTPSANATITAQVHLYEGSGRIVFAYTTTGDYSRGRYVCGIDSYGDTRFTAPLLATNQNVGYPGSDFIFDPRSVTYTGTLLFDRIVSDANGIGSSADANRPIARSRVELRRDGGIVANATVTADDGTFSITGFGVASTSTGALAVLAGNQACNVTSATGGAPLEWAAASNISCASNANLNTLALTAAADSTGATRAPFYVADVCRAAWSWASARTTAVIPRIDVLVDPTKALSTAYVTGTPPWLSIGSGLSANSDVWDAAIITKAYARLVLAKIAALPATTADDRFDAVTDTQNAFAEAFGYYLWAAVSGSTQAIDGLSASTASVHDLESPTVTVTKGPDVAGCMAGALFDLLDGANETIDTVDGSTTPERVLQIVDSFTVAPTASTFLQAWVDAGYDAPSITRIFVGNGALPDDSLETNDSRTEAASLGSVGVRRANLVLNRFNEDWYSVTLPADAPSLLADVKWDRVTVNATVGLEIRDTAGTLLATGSSQSATAPLHAATGPVAQGTYKIGVRHLGGETVPVYTVQTYRAIEMTDAPLPDWTVGRSYDQDFAVHYGVAPYTLGTTGAGVLPPGIGIDPLDFRAVGTPTAVGTYPVNLQLKDSGDPANIVARSRTVTIHDVLKIAVAPFVGFALGKSGDVTLPTTGGTPPFTLAMTSGALPSGLVFDPNSLHVTGTITAGPSSAFELDGVDVAGSPDHVATRGVVAHPASGKNVVADLVAGEDACGWWFDAVEGSTVSFTATTAKGHVKRVLAGLVLAPDRSAVLTGKIKTKLGSLTGSGLLCPTSGRYYVIASSTDGEATQLLGNVHVLPPKAGKSKIPVFAPADTTTVEVGALPGATLTLKFAGQKATGLVAKIVSVNDPTGTGVPFVASLKASSIGGTLTMTLPVGGTWTIELGATSTSGVPGKFSYSYAIKQPKGVPYSAD